MYYYAYESLMQTLSLASALFLFAGVLSIWLYYEEKLEKNFVFGVIFCIISLFLAMPIPKLKNNLTLENQEKDLIVSVEKAEKTLNDFYILHPELKE